MDEAILLERPLGKTTRFLKGMAFSLLIVALVFYAIAETLFSLVSFPINEISSPKYKKSLSLQYPVPSLKPFMKRSLKETLFLPELVNSIYCYQNPPRPDRIEAGRYFAFANDPYSFLSFGEECYLMLTPRGFEKSTGATPLSLSLSPDRRFATLSLRIITSDNVEVLQAIHQFPLSEFPNVITKTRSKEFESFCKKIEHLSLYPPDAFFSAYGGKIYREKGKYFRLGSLSSQVYPLEPGALFTLHYDALVPLVNPKNAETPLFQVVSISHSRVEIEAWDVTGKEYALISITPHSAQGLDVKPEELFKDIRIRGVDKALVKVGKKTKLLRPGDYLLRTETSWKLIDEKDELEGMLNYLNCGMLFVFEGVLQKGSDVCFTGRLFDETRSVQKKVELPIKVKKKTKHVPQRNRSDDVLRENYEEFPPELEELLEELDDI